MDAIFMNKVYSNTTRSRSDLKGFVAVEQP